MRTNSFIILAVLNAFLFTTAALGSDTATSTDASNPTQARPDTSTLNRPIVMSADINRDSRVDGTDIAIVLAGWGNCSAHSDASVSTLACEGDVNQDGRVDINDLVFVLNHWG